MNCLMKAISALIPIRLISKVTLFAENIFNKIPLAYL